MTVRALSIGGTLPDYVAPEPAPAQEPDSAPHYGHIGVCIRSAEPIWLNPFDSIQVTDNDTCYVITMQYTGTSFHIDFVRQEPT